MLTAPVLIAVVLLPGCGKDTYSDKMTYPLRKDPLVRSEFPKEQEFNEPDPPNVLPIMAFNDIFKKNNKYYYDLSEAIEDKELLRDMDPKFWGNPKDQDTIKEYLDGAFGTPAAPTVRVPTDYSSKSPLKDADLDLLQLDAKTLQHGSNLYRLHCLYCHGLTGDGRGPTARWVNPHPRDYRPGVYKFQSIDQATGGVVNLKPRRSDLYRTLHQGIEGTSMQAFNTLPAADLEALVSYVIHLSIRGQVEYDTILAFDFDFASIKLNWTKKENIPEYMAAATQKIVGKWADAEDPKSWIVPGPYSKRGEKEMIASVQKGHNLFLGKEKPAVNCVSCHKDYGRQSAYKFDDWGTLGAKPRDLTKSQYRGGRRPIDLYYRIHSGINGSNMQPHGASLTPDELWNVVDFVQALPYPAMRKKYGIEVE